MYFRITNANIANYGKESKCPVPKRGWDICDNENVIGYDFCPVLKKDGNGKHLYLSLKELSVRFKGIVPVRARALWYFCQDINATL